MNPDLAQLPRLRVVNRQRRVSIEMARVKAGALAAVSSVAASVPGPRSRDLPGLDEVEVSVVSDRRIGAVHAQFLGDPSPTDVITFQHGEILVSADTALREALRRKVAVESELILYILHGLLHLNGYDDHVPADRTEMQAIQGRLFRTISKSSKK